MKSPEKAKEVIVYEEVVEPYNDDSLPFEEYLKLFNTS
jgi:hypothetical protein